MSTSPLSRIFEDAAIVPRPPSGGYPGDRREPLRQIGLCAEVAESLYALDAEQ